MDDKTFAKLKEIQSRMPQFIKDNILIKKPAYDKVKFVMEEALKNPDISESKKDEIRTYLGTGQLEKELTETNPDVAKQADKWLSIEIKKAIRKGEIPHPSKDPLFRKLRAKFKKRK